MKRKMSSRSALLLIELIMAILIFSLSGAICLQLFVKSHSLGERTQQLDIAVRQASSVCEILTQEKSPQKVLSGLYPDAHITPDSMSIYYDQDFHACGWEQAYFQINITAASSHERLTLYSISVCKDGNATTVYSTQATAYRQYLP